MGCFHDFGTPESQWVRDYARKYFPDQSNISQENDR
jgi:hypothetical protein